MTDITTSQTDLHVKIPIVGMGGDTNRSLTLEQALAAEPGVFQVTVNPTTHSVDFYCESSGRPVERARVVIKELGLYPGEPTIA